MKKSFFKQLLLIMALLLVGQAGLASDDNEPLLKLFEIPSIDEGLPQKYIPGAGLSEEELATISGEAIYSTPRILIALALPNYVSHKHRQLFELDQSHEILLRSPDFNKDWIKAPPIEEMSGKTVLSLGEGTSGLVPYLLRRGLIAHGLDLWYDKNLDVFAKSIDRPLMEAYRRKFHVYTRAGNAADLTDVGMPTVRIGKYQREAIEDEEYDMVVSHRLIGFLTAQHQTDLLAEALRVLKPGGSIRIHDVLDDHKQLHEQLEALKKTGQRFSYALLQVRGRAQLMGATYYFDAFTPEEISQITLGQEIAGAGISMQIGGDPIHAITLVIIKPAAG